MIGRTLKLLKRRSQLWTLRAQALTLGLVAGALATLTDGSGHG